MSKVFKTLEEQIEKYDKIDLNTAQKLYKKYLESKDKNIRNQLINSTLYVVINFVKRSNLDILSNGIYDLDDIMSSSIEYYINEIDKGSLLEITSFFHLFDSKYYTYLDDIYALQKENIEMNSINDFKNLIEIYLELKTNKIDVSFSDYLDKVKNAYDISEYSTGYFKEFFKVFENIYENVNLKERDTLCVRKLTFMRNLLVDISLRERYDGTNIVDSTNYEEDIIKKHVINNSIKYIFEKSNLKEREKIILINKFGLNGEEEKTLKKIGKILGFTPQRVHELKGYSLLKLRKSLYMKKLKKSL